MQILGKRSKVLLIAVAIVMLVTIGISFAAWDSMSAVKATGGNSGSYANANVGDVIEFGQYYIDSTINKKSIEWIVVDKNERTGQLTLMSRYILACGSYFGNYYYDSNNDFKNHYSGNEEINQNPFNQAYVDSTVRAYLNNLERLDIGGDSFDENLGYVQSGINSTEATGLLSSVGYSNRKYFTGLTTSSPAYINNTAGLVYAYDSVFFQRPISSLLYEKRTATKGFYDEAFTDEQKSMIAPKAIAGCTGNRWPDGTHEISKKSYIEGALDKVWIASATELNIVNGHDWTNQFNDDWTVASDEASSTVFEYFKNWNRYKNPYDRSRNNITLEDTLKAFRTAFALEGCAGNYSIPVYKKGTMIENESISRTANTTENYWTRSATSQWYTHMRVVGIKGTFIASPTYDAQIGVRPCIVLKY